MLERKGHEQNQSQRDLICLNLPEHEMRVSETWMALFFQMKWNGGPQVHGQIQSILFQIPSQTDSQHVELGFLGSSYVPSFPSSERITTRETSLACALLPVARLLDRSVNFSCTLSTCSITRPLFDHATLRLFYVHMSYMYSDSECIAINGYGCITSIEIKYAMAIVLVFL